MANSYWEKRSIDVEKLIQEKNDRTVIKVNEYFESCLTHASRTKLDG